MTPALNPEPNPALLAPGNKPTASFAGCHYNGHSRAFTIQLANVPLADSALLASIIALWTDPALEPHLAKIKAGHSVLAVVRDHFEPVSKAQLCAPQLN